MSKPYDDLGLQSPPENESGQDGTVFLFISLYSLLLAFFIMLFTTATISKHKADVVTGSVKESFQKTPSSSKKDAVPVSLLPYGNEVLLQQSYGEIRKVARELLAIDDSAITQKGDILVLRLPVFLLFSGDTATIDDRKQFIQNLANSVTTAPAGLQLDIEFKLPRLPDVAKADQLLVNRAGAFARLLVQMGVPEDTIYVGMSEGRAEMLEITFSPRNVVDADMQVIRP